MSDNVSHALAASVCFVLIGCVTWFFSTRRSALIRFFSPPGEVRRIARSVPRDWQFSFGMRFIALLQIGVGLLVFFIAVKVWISS